MVLLQLDKEKKWTKITEEDKALLPPDEQKKVIYLDGKFWKCLEHYKHMQEKNNDVVIIIEGLEGSGKSTLQGMILEFISDGRFDPKNDLVGADYLDGLEKIERAKKRGWLGFDEGNVFFLATETTKREHRDLHKIFSIFRQKNLFVVICLPSFFRLGTYFAIDRSVGLVRTYFKKSRKGYFCYYGRSRKDKLYTVGKRTYNPNAVKPRLKGRFTTCYKLETQEYKNFKENTLSTEIEKAREKFKKPPTKFELEQKILKDFVEKNFKYKTKELASMLGVGERRIQQLKKMIREDKEKKSDNSLEK